MLHLLHAYLTDDCTFLGQEKTADKSNEITAIPILLEILDLKNALVSIDAMDCQIEIAEKIIEKGGIKRGNLKIVARRISKKGLRKI